MSAHSWKDFTAKEAKRTCWWTACTVCGVLQPRDPIKAAEECSGDMQPWTYCVALGPARFV